MDIAQLGEIPKEPGSEVLYWDTSHDKLRSERKEEGTPYHFIICKHIINSRLEETWNADASFIETDITYASKIETILGELLLIALQKNALINCRFMVYDSPEVALMLLNYGFRTDGNFLSNNKSLMLVGEISLSNTLLGEFFANVTDKYPHFSLRRVES